MCSEKTRLTLDEYIECLDDERFNWLHMDGLEPEFLAPVAGDMRKAWNGDEAASSRVHRALLEFRWAIVRRGCAGDHDHSAVIRRKVGVQQVEVRRKRSRARAQLLCVLKALEIEQLEASRRQA
jgi:hypothetical protein